MLFAAGALGVLSMAPFFLWPVLALALPVLVWAIDGAGVHDDRRVGLRSAALAGWWFGFGYFVPGLFWVGEAFLVEADKFAWALPFAVTLLPAGLALFFALAAAASRLAWPAGVARVLVLAVAISVTEWLRGHILTGFPWNTLGYALTAPLPLMQTAAIVGIYGLTLLTVGVLASPLVVLEDRQRTGRGSPAVAMLLMTAVPLAAMLAYGLAVLARPIAEPLAGVTLRIVQPSIPQREKWLPDKQGWNFALHLTLSREPSAGASSSSSGITHIVWPEAAMPFLPLERAEALAAIGDMLPEGVRLIAGALRLVEGQSGGGARRAYNSLMVFGPGGQLEGLYDKTHLVPFGEYLPLEGLLQRIGLEKLTRWRGGFSIGQVPRPLMNIAGLPPIGALICYEAIFPAAVVQGRERPGLLVNVTNDGWFGNTTGPRQHLHQARVRAVEEGLGLVRAANNGISAVIDAEGRVVASLGMNVRGVLDVAAPGGRATTVYGRLGDLTYLVLVAATLIAVVFLTRRRVS